MTSLPLTQFDDPPAESRKIHSVTELTGRIKRLINDNFKYVWVCGEVSNVTYHQNGFIYFSLKDEKAKIDAVIYKNVVPQIRFKIEEGMELICFGQVTIYEPRSAYQIVVYKAEPKGVGALQLAFEQLKAKLQKEGLFDPVRKKPIPMLPRTVAIVTSPTGAALQDMLRVISNRFPKMHVLIHPVRVQGEGAAAEIAEAVYRLNMRGGIDVMIIGRGGGSIEDLWAFNEEILARAIAASRIPIISAVGHEVDTTISDYVADMRALTPTNAAEIVTTPTYADLSEHLEQLKIRLTEAIRNDVAFLRQRLDTSRDSYAFEQPRHRYETYVQRVQELDTIMKTRMLHRRDELRSRLDVYREKLTPKTLLTGYQNQRARLDHHREKLSIHIANSLALRREHLKELGGLLHSLSPLNVLQRGYSITKDGETGKVVKSASDAHTGQILRTRLHRGDITSRVESTTPTRDLIDQRKQID